MENRKRNTLFVFGINAVIALLFLSGQYYTAAIGIKKGAFIAAIVLFLILFLPALSYIWPFMNQTAGKVRERLTDVIGYIRTNPKRMLKGLMMYVCAALLGLIITVIYSKIQVRNFVWPVFHMSFTLATIPVTIYLLRNQLGKKPEFLFAALLITAGIYFINASPAELGVTWDDEAHYERTLTMANLPSGVIYYADEEIFGKQVVTALDHFGYSEEDRTERRELLNYLYRNRVTVPYTYRGMGNYSTLSYVPFAFGVTVGRGLHLPFTVIFRVGKLMNLLTYAAMICYAMSRLRFGKILVASIAMLPTMTYMASSYSYDPFVVGMMLVGFSVFFSYLQDPDSKMKNSDIGIICISFLLGCLPKAVYCVIMLPLLFMPASRFVSKKQHTMYILCGCLTVALLGATFVLPRLIQGNMGTGDMRGGAQVNATKQFAYIQEDWGRFAGVLWYFYTSTYLTPANTLLYMENYAYLGVNLSNYVTPLMLLAVAIFDRDGKPGKNMLITVSSLIGVVLGILIVAFTFYLSYTPVGYNTVLGCQWRYLMPMVFPFLYAVCSDRIKNPFRKNIFNTLPMLWMTLSFVIFTGTKLISMY